MYNKTQPKDNKPTENLPVYKIKTINSMIGSGHIGERLSPQI